MTRYLVDTNVALRWADKPHALHPIAVAAVTALKERGDTVYVTAQNLIEFWNVATRPEEKRGFGYSPSQADEDVARVERFFAFAPDTPDVYPTWRRLVREVGVSGVQVHDARLVAVMMVHGITHILTFNGKDFARYPGITVVDPIAIAV